MCAPGKQAVAAHCTHAVSGQAAAHLHQLLCVGPPGGFHAPAALRQLRIVLWRPWRELWPQLGLQHLRGTTSHSGASATRATWHMQHQCWCSMQAIQHSSLLQLPCTAPLCRASPPMHRLFWLVNTWQGGSARWVRACSPGTHLLPDLVAVQAQVHGVAGEQLPHEDTKAVDVHAELNLPGSSA